MATYKRKPRCGYCYQEGHNRNSCPAVKQAAANGDSYAQERLERAKVKRCSYCRTDGHTKATCDTKFTDELSHGWMTWAGLNAAVNVIREKKLATGAFVYAPILHRWHDFPEEFYDREGVKKPNYELINFCITDVKVSGDTALEDTNPHLGYTTLAELSDDSVRLKTYYSLPGLYEAVVNLDESFEQGKRAWLKRNNYTSRALGRKTASELCSVIVEASEEEIERAVNNILSQKPVIVDYTDRKTYQSAVRAQNKKIKNELNDEED